LISGLVSSGNSVPSIIPTPLGISNFFLILSAMIILSSGVGQRTYPLHNFKIAVIALLT
jgi:hypothetical protein